MTVQLNMFCYGNMQDPSNVEALMHTHICPIYLYDWTLNDLAYCHNKTHSTKQSLSVDSESPCNLNRVHSSSRLLSSSSSNIGEEVNGHVIEVNVVNFNENIS